MTGLSGPVARAGLDWPALRSQNASSTCQEISKREDILVEHGTPSIHSLHVMTPYSFCFCLATLA